MRKVLLLLVSCVGVTVALNSWELPKTDLLSFVNEELDQDWIRFKRTYNKTYWDANEEVRRRLYWEDTLKFIEEHNLKYERGESTYFVGENDFADMAEDEFEKIYLRGLILPEVEEEYPEALTEPDPEVPLEVDWRKGGLVSSVKNQGRCGSCWAFSALGALEGQWAKKTRRLLDFSEQNLVDCANSRYGNYGCRGGWMDNAYRYIKENGGVDGEKCYPYQARDGYCRYKRSCRAAGDNGSNKVGRSEHSLEKAVSAIGPIANAMDVSNQGFWFYKGGIYYVQRCNGKAPNHAMLVVGYGSTRGSDFWTIKNSWGTGWGSNGYLYAAKNKGDLCGIALWASFPLV